MPQASRGWGIGRGIPLPTGEGSGRGCAVPLARNFFVFFVDNTIF